MRVYSTGLCLSGSTHSYLSALVTHLAAPIVSHWGVIVLVR